MKSKYIIIGVVILVVVIGIVILVINPFKPDVGEESEQLSSGEIQERKLSSIPFFGIGEDFNKENDMVSLTSKDLKELNVGIARTEGEPFIWNLIEPKKGEFDFTITDKAVGEAADSQILILATLWSYALWDQGGKEECKVAEGFKSIPNYRCKPQDMGAHKSFLKELVERYDGDDDFGSYPIEDSLKNKIKQNPVIYWEINNEVDSPGLRFFAGSLEDYFDLLKNSYEAIKESCEECQVVIAAPVGPPTGSVKNYYSSLLSLGAGNYFDIYNLHDSMSKLKETIGTIDKPVFVTEAGGGKAPEMAKIAISLAADGFASAFLSAVPTKGKYDQKTSIFGQSEEEFFEEHIVGKDGSKTLQYYALQTLATELKYFQKLEPYEVKEGVTGFKFYFEDKAPIYIFFIGELVRYSTDPAFQIGNEQETLSLDFEEFLVKDLYGNEETKSKSFTLQKDNVYFVTEIK